MSEVGEPALKRVRIAPAPPPPIPPVLAIARVAFAGHRTVEQDTLGNFASPEWTAAPAVSHPVAYTRNTQVQLTPTFNVTTAPSVATQVTVTGTCNFGGTVLTWTGNVAVNPGDATVTTAAALASNVALPNVVGCYDPAAIAWTATPTAPAAAATPAGQSTHVIYAPLGNAVGGVADHWTLLDVSCRAAAGQNTADNVVTQTVAAFPARNMVRKRDNHALTYWNPDPTDAQTTADILGRADGSGQCGAWAELLRDMARVHGIDRLHKVHVEVPPVLPIRQFGFQVKNWVYTGPAPAADLYGYTHAFRVAGPGGCMPGARLPAQGNANSPDEFANHYIVYDTTTHQFYDPSYGTTAASHAAWEDAAIDGTHHVVLPFFAPAVPGLPPIVVGNLPARGRARLAGAATVLRFTDMVNNANL